MGRAAIIYETFTGETREIAQFIAEGITSSGHAAELLEADRFHDASELQAFDALVLGSPTYYCGLPQKTKSLLALARKAQLQGKIGASFGSYIHAGEAPDLIHQAMQESLGLEMAAAPLKLKFPLLGDGENRARELGRTIGNSMG
jgi:flavorubredoxin